MYSNTRLLLVLKELHSNLQRKTPQPVILDYYSLTTKDDF